MLREILKGLLNTEMSVFYTLVKKTREIPSLLYTFSLKSYPFRVKPPRLVHYREYPSVSKEEAIFYSNCLKTMKMLTKGQPALSILWLQYQRQSLMTF